MVTHEEMERLRETLANVDFPAGKDAILEEVGRSAASVNTAHRRIAELLEQVPENRFRSLHDLMAEIRHHVPAFQGAPSMYDDDGRGGP